ncbi:MAG: AbrB/MazE/SpoVT family DNA-binding domain-containing protein [Chloroflexi bacterium]|nr:AbrB/MazE/SpoVT family DNA-binding domain-containing protein [Chloroflexota bacterium]
MLTTITKKGQVTLPAEVRRLLGVGPRDKVAFVVSADQVCVVRPRSVVERTAGVFKGTGPVLTAEELRVAAEEAIADDVMERAGL